MAVVRRRLSPTRKSPRCSSYPAIGIAVGLRWPMGTRWISAVSVSGAVACGPNAEVRRSHDTGRCRCAGSETHPRLLGQEQPQPPDRAVRLTMLGGCFRAVALPAVGWGDQAMVARALQRCGQSHATGTWVCRVNAGLTLMPRGHRACGPGEQIVRQSVVCDTAGRDSV